jgi:hypothetical protein
LAPLGWKKRTRLEKGLAILWLLLLGGAVVRVAAGSWVTDDFFITLRYADHVVAGDGPVYNTGERTEGYTHFLWFCLITVGRVLGIDGVGLGRFLGLPAFVGTLLLLLRISGRLFPRGGLWGFPVAAIAWALHEDALLYASGGLETAAFILALLIAFEALCLSSAAGAVRTAAWAFACATLLRPEGMLFSLLALGFLLWQRGRRRGLEFLLFWTVLVAPLFIFRLAFYGELLPNTYYAKSGAGAYWQQGLHYLTAYFASYFALGFAFLAAVPILRDLRRSDSRFGRRADAALLFALAVSVALIVYVTRIGGDYMFARFFLPITPFLLLLCESLPQRLPRRSWTGAGALFLVALVWSGAFVKHRLAFPRARRTGDPGLLRQLPGGDRVLRAGRRTHRTPEAAPAWAPGTREVHRSRVRVPTKARAFPCARRSGALATALHPAASAGAGAARPRPCRDPHLRPRAHGGAAHLPQNRLRRLPALAGGELPAAGTHAAATSPAS